MKVVVIIPAAGLGTRMAPMPSAMDAKSKKNTSLEAIYRLGGTPILIHTLRKFAAVSEIARFGSPCAKTKSKRFRERLKKEAADVLKKKIELVVGASTARNPSLTR